MANIDWDALVDFVGYGPSHPVDLLFLGLEERAVEEQRNLAARAQFRPVEDLRFAHKHVLAAAGCHNPFEHPRGDPVKQWNTAARFALSFSGTKDWNDRAVWSAYWRNELGRAHGSTFLMECFPYPRRDRSTSLPGKPKLTEEVMWKRRLSLLREHTQQYPAKFVVAYGKATKQKAEEIFSISYNAWRPVPGLKRAAQIATNGTTCVAHVGFFGRSLFVNDDIPAIVSSMQDRAGAS